jgi:ABC-type transport system substrate-binding protein
MRTKKQFKPILFICLIVISIVALCIRWRDVGPREQSLADTGTTYVKAVYSLPVTLDPIEMNDTASLLYSELAYDGLVRFVDSYNIAPAIAESWSIKNDRIYTFKIRKTARFQNGEPILADDVIASISRLGSGKSVVKRYFDMISEMKKLSDHEIQISLEKPYPPFLYIMAGATAKIFPAKLVNGSDFFKAPVGAGPFRLTNIDRSKAEFRLEKFEGHYDADKIKISKIILTAMEQAKAEVLAKQGYIHDLIDWPLSGQEKVFAIGQDHSAQMMQTWIVGLNTRLEPFKNIEERKAFVTAFNSDEFRAKFYPDSVTAHGYVPPGLPGYTSISHKLPNSKFQPPKSKITIEFPAGFEQAEGIKAYVEASYKKQGWNVEVKIMPWDQMMEGYSKKTLQAFIVSMNMDYPDPDFLLQNFESTNSDNYSGINDPEIDKLLREARSIADGAKRKNLYEIVSKKIDAQYLTVNLFHPRVHYWVHECVRGFEPNYFSDVYIDYRKIYLEKNCLQLRLAGK